jgi:hypothetical protein
MSSASNIIRNIGRGGNPTEEKNNENGSDDDSGFEINEDHMDVIEFVESPAGLGFTEELSGVSLFPVQRFILKAFYNHPLEKDEKTIKIPKSWRHAQSQDEDDYHLFTEQEYMEYLYNNGRCNIKELDGDRHELVLPIGRRSGKSFISGIIAAFETYKLLRKGNPQKYYGLPEGDRIQISSVATATEQAGILYKEAKRHFNNCDFYDQYLAKNTMSYVQFQTPRDIQETGRAEEGGDQSVRVTFYSSVSSGIRGSANIVVIMDEVAFFNREGESSAEAVYEAVEPSVATFSPKPDNPDDPIPDSEGRIIMISSPYSKDGLFYRKYRDSKGSGAGADDILMVQAPTWEVNPTISADTFAKSYDKDPRVFQTEFGAQFSDKVQTWIEREEDLQVCIDKELKPKKRGTTRDPHYIGLDLAAKNDRTALALTKPTDEKVRMQYHEQWQAGENWYELNPHLEEPLVDYCKGMQDVEVLDFDEIANWVHQISKKFYIQKGVFDQFEGISFEQTIHKMGLSQIEMKNFRPSETSEMFQAFRTLMFHEKLELYDYEIEDDDPSDHSPYINEILELRSESSGRRNIKVYAPKVAGKHDDFTDALIRSVWLSYQQIKDGANIGRSPNRPAQNDGDGGKAGSREQPSYRDYRTYQRKKKKSRNYVSKRDPNKGR